MSEVYSKTPPTEPGWYWVKCFGEFIAHKLESLNGTHRWVFTESDPIWAESWMIENGYQFGPRVPSAEDLMSLTELARQFSEFNERNASK